MVSQFIHISFETISIKMEMKSYRKLSLNQDISQIISEKIYFIDIYWSKKKTLCTFYVLKKTV